MDTFHNSDAETGSLTSPAFTIDKTHLNFLIGGGNHPYVPGGSTAAPAGDTFQDFEGDSLPGWTGTGSFAGIAPSKESLSGQLGSGVLDTCQAGCDAAEGTITSPTFTVAHPYINLLTAGGEHPWGQANPTSVNLVVNGNVVASVTGNNTPNMDWVHMDASAYIGQQATLQVVDESDGSAGWGHMMVDNIVFSDAIANPWNTETGANLIVDGQVVRTATGNNSGLLDWTSWDLSDLQGKQAQLQLVDLNAGGWGHLLADQFTLADQPALSMTQRAHWLDYGHDFYAAVTFNDAPANQRIALGWMNNWDYANTIPTNGWRGTQSAPRILSLRTIDGQPRIVQKVAPQVTRWLNCVSSRWLGRPRFPLVRRSCQPQPVRTRFASMPFWRPVPRSHSGCSFSARQTARSTFRLRMTRQRERSASIEPTPEMSASTLRSRASTRQPCTWITGCCAWRSTWIRHPSKPSRRAVRLRSRT